MIIVRIHHGLGNQLFQYAYAKNLAIKYNKDLLFDLSFYNSPSKKLKKKHNRFKLDCLNIDHKIADNKDIDFFNNNFFGKVLRKINKTLTEFNIKPIYKHHVTGHGQYYFHFEENLESIIQTIDLKENLKSTLQKNRFYKIISQTKNSVAIHVRRDDYVQNERFNLCNNNYFNKSIEYINKKIEEPHYFIFSQDHEWCKKNLSFKKSKFSHVKGVGDDLIEFFVMSYCKNFIISNSTYSWWAAILNNYKEKIVIAPYIWKIDSNGKKIFTKEIVPDKWEIMEFS